MRAPVRSAALCAAILVAGPAQAAPSAELTRIFQAGVDAYRLGKYDEARSQLDKARALDPKLPGPHRFLAAVARAQQRWSECIAETRRALTLNPQSREIAETRKLHEACRVAAGRPAFREELGDRAAIMVTANVAGASVRIGKLRYGGTPVAPRLLAAGPHELDIEKPGWKPAHVTIDALPGVVTDVEVVLEVASASPAKPPVKPRPAASKSG